VLTPETDLRSTIRIFLSFYTRITEGEAQVTKNTQVSVNMRKIPKQERSIFTIEAILDATAQLLENEPASAITTNHISRHAGISIGTLYQYFPNKSAVITALANRGRWLRAMKVINQLATAETDSIDEVTREIIRTLIAVFANSHSDQQLTMLMTIQRLERPTTESPIDDVATVVANTISSILDVPKSQTEFTAYVITRAVMGTIRSTVLDAPHLLEEQEFEDQLVRLVTGFLGAQ
jgi:AcrR family transcriptional regulator